MDECLHYFELISAKLDGELTDSESAELTAHLDGCPRCRALLEAYASVSRGVAQLEAEPPEGLAKGVMYKISLEKKPPRRVYFGFATALAAVAALVIIGGSAGLLDFSPFSRSSGSLANAATAMADEESAVYAEEDGFAAKATGAVQPDEARGGADTGAGEPAYFSAPADSAALTVAPASEDAQEGGESFDAPTAGGGVMMAMAPPQPEAEDGSATMNYDDETESFMVGETPDEAPIEEAAAEDERSSASYDAPAKAPAQAPAEAPMMTFAAPAPEPAAAIARVYLEPVSEVMLITGPTPAELGELAPDEDVDGEGRYYVSRERFLELAQLWEGQGVSFVTEPGTDSESTVCVIVTIAE